MNNLHKEVNLGTIPRLNIIDCKGNNFDCFVDFEYNKKGKIFNISKRVFSNVGVFFEYDNERMEVYNLSFDIKKEDKEYLDKVGFLNELKFDINEVVRTDLERIMIYYNNSMEDIF